MHSEGESGHGHAHFEHLQHHFDTPIQQFDASKLGMWLFLATEILLFGGLFCAYAVYRAARPEVFLWAHHMLDKNLGAINTGVLLVSSLTMAWAVRCAQLNQRKGLIVLLSLTLLGGFGFMGIKYAEYRSKWKHGLLWASSYEPDEHYLSEHFGLGGSEHEEQEGGPPEEERVADLERGLELFRGTCASCHGRRGEGIVNQGVELRESEFVASRSVEEMVDFLKSGRQPFDPNSRMHLLMPPRGGNPVLTDDKLYDIAAYVLELNESFEPEAKAAEETAEGPEEAAAAEDRPGELEFVLERSVIPPGARGPSGLREEALDGGHDAASLAVEPENAQTFFSVYFLMTGLHGLHVLAGMALIGWLLRRAIRGDFGSDYFTPVDLGGLYWHLVDLIWIFLFPLLYLIH